jgi:hypothetical protein
MTAVDLIREVERRGGRVSIEDGQVVVECPGRLPAELVEALSREKPALMVALGAPFDAAVASILLELRPNLPPSLRALSDANLLAMVNWSIMAAWHKTIRGLGSRA